MKKQNKGVAMCSSLSHFETNLKDSSLPESLSVNPASHKSKKIHLMERQLSAPMRIQATQRVAGSRQNSSNISPNDNSFRRVQTLAFVRKFGSK